MIIMVNTTPPGTTFQKSKVRNQGISSPVSTQQARFSLFLKNRAFPFYRYLTKLAILNIQKDVPSPNIHAYFDRTFGSDILP